MSAVTVTPTDRVHGRVRPPGDKSISHRYALLSAIANGPSTVHGFSTGADCISTLNCLRALGTPIDELGRDASGLSLRIHGRGLTGFSAPSVPLDAGNSGSTIRMLVGLLVGHPFRSTLTGDASLRCRPMRRVIAPLERMGARFEDTDGGLPLTIHGTSSVTPITFRPELPSAQVKSAVLLAGLYGQGSTKVHESIATRDHTERALPCFGVAMVVNDRVIAVSGGQQLTPVTYTIPGDISSAAFWMTAAAALPGSEIVIENVGLNPTRTGLLAVLRRAGAQIEATRTDKGSSEPSGTVIVRHASLGPIIITPSEVPSVIDELPVLAALATHGGGLTVSGAAELRVKESDRIKGLVDGFRRMGADILEQSAGFVVRASRRLRGGEVDARNDHRLAMAFAIAALGASGPTVIHGAEATDISYPEFFNVLDTLRT